MLALFLPLFSLLKDDPKQRKPDITKAKTLLKWEPTVPLREGLEKMTDWLEERLSLGRFTPNQ